MKLLQIAARNLTRQKRRSATIALAIAFCFGISIALGALAKGAGTTGLDYFANSLGGHVFIELDHLEGDDQSVEMIRNPATVVAQLEALGIPAERIVPRSSAYGSMSPTTDTTNDTRVGLNGLGDSERSRLARHFHMVQGELDVIGHNPRAIIISSRLAKTLQVTLGDELQLATSTIRGQRTILDLQVGAIYEAQGDWEESDTYMDLESLNRLIGLAEDEAGYLMVRLDDAESAHQWRDYLRRELGKYYVANTESTGSIFNNTMMREVLVMDDSARQVFAGDRLVVRDLLDAGAEIIASASNFIRIGSLVILSLILLVTVMGLGNNYRMIILERSREIGTLRAVGMQRRAVVGQFAAEGGILLLISLLAGAVLAVLIVTIMGFVPANVPDYARPLFLGGRFHFRMDWPFSLLTCLGIILAVLGAVYRAALRAATVEPAQALRESN